MTAPGHAGRIAEPVAVLIVRAWIERDPAPHLRARVTRSLAIERDDETVSAADDADEVCAIVREWLQSFVARNGA